jgi:4-hydroxy-tetrahydrodipicolinate reductase
MAARPRLLVFGAGRMGEQVAGAADKAGFDLKAVVSRRQPDWLDHDYWRPGLDTLPDLVDIAIDFSLPQGTMTLAPWCAEHGVPLVCGTTGLHITQRDALSAAAARVPVLWAANFSIGVNVCLGLVAAAARQLRGVRSVEVFDRHHQHKKDMPSGTALALGEAASPYPPVYDSEREGEVIGDHEVRFCLPGEVVEIAHRASDRSIYANGALHAGRWLLEQRPGTYSMLDCVAATRT